MFPCAVEKAAINALPLGIVSIPQLWVTDLTYWMENRGLRCPFEGSNRPLRGCLIAFGGKGLVFVNGYDPDDERRFTVAHEVAHFILDYDDVRARAAKSLGIGILEVLDGKRPATFEERIHATLSDASIGVHTHTMDRSPEGDIYQGSVLKAEETADLLALELIAPAEEIYSRLNLERREFAFNDLIGYTVKILEQDFGLPKSIVGSYAFRLADNIAHGPTIKEWLGLDR
jgi:Zn-dependent peptidase ImmA (M78 family)